MRSKLPGRDDRGVGLVEVLVALGLIAVVGVIVTSVIMNSNKVSKRTIASTTSQATLIDALSRVTRDVATANPIITAKANTLSVQTLRDGTCLRTEYTVEQTGSAYNLVSRVWTAAGNCPAAKVDMAGTPQKTTVVPGLIKEGGAAITNLADLVTFTYYDDTNKAITLSTDGVEDTSKIKRVGVALSAKVNDRPEGVTLKTSMAPRSGLDPDGNPLALDEPPAPPTNTATITACQPQATVSWSAVAGATSYIILRDGSTVANPSASAGTTYIDSPLQFGRTYQWQVFSQSAAGISAAPIPATATRCPAAPVLKGNVIDNNGDQYWNDNGLNWNKPSGTTSFILYKDGTPIGPSPATAVSLIDPNVAWSSNHRYTVRAVNSGGTSAPSNEVALLIRPAAPRLSGTVVGTTNNIRLAWTQSTAADGFYIYLLNGTRVATVADGSATSYTLPEPWGSTTDFYMTAYNASTPVPESLKSNQVAGTIRPAAPVLSGSFSRDPLVDPDKPEDGTATVSLSWTAPAGAVEYRLFRNGSEIYRGTSLSYTDRYRPLGTSDSYVVYAVDYHRNYPTTAEVAGVTSFGGGVSNASNVYGPQYPPPNPRIELNETCLCVGQNHTKLMWYPVTGAVDYLIYRNGSLVATFPENGDENWWWDDYTAADGSTHTYYIVARNAAGVSGRSVTVTNIMPPSGPSLSGSQGSGYASTANLSWSAETGASAYYLYRDGVLIYSGSSRSYSDSGPVSGWRYTYRVFAANVEGVSPTSNEVSLMIGANPRPDRGTRLGPFPDDNVNAGESSAGSYIANRQLSFCIDMNSKSPLASGGYGSWNLVDYTETSAIRKQTGWDTNFNGGGINGSYLSSTDISRLSYAVATWGDTQSETVAAALDHYIRIYTAGDSDQRTRLNKEWAAILDYRPSAQSSFDTINSQTDRYRGPYSFQVTWPTSALTVGQTATARVRIVSSTGYGIPGVKIFARVSSGYNGPGMLTSDANGYVNVTFSPDCNKGLQLSVVAMNLPVVGVYVASPDENYAQRMLSANNKSYAGSWSRTVTGP